MDHPGTPAPAGQPITSAGEISHRGEVFGAGWGATFYGVWNLKSGVLVAKFDRDQQGWEQAWREFQNLEAQQIPKWRRLNWWTPLHVFIGLVVVPLLEVVLISVILTATGRIDSDQNEEIGRQIGERVGLLVFATGLAGWLLFVYVRPRTLRWVVSTAVLLLGFVVALVQAFSLT